MIISERQIFMLMEGCRECLRLCDYLRRDGMLAESGETLYGQIVALVNEINEQQSTDLKEIKE